ncbi:hypothetical protein M9H77_17755 [Catharanthus roseus]|uniref:Uncharacterized protein n=1 Tax=Catharanthus roseus TaxID=4058 RepID=A0ACC0B5J3_CATRO|nr:hypothetical protein M9H77_17755 [Catharanthus roseus]
MQESTTLCIGGASGCADDEGAGLNDVPIVNDEEEGVRMGLGLEYGNYRNRVKVARGVDVIAGEIDIPRGIEADARFAMEHDQNCNVATMFASASKKTPLQTTLAKEQTPFEKDSNLSLTEESTKARIPSPILHNKEDLNTSNHY